LETFEPNPDKQQLDPQDALASLITIANNLAQIEQRIGRGTPDVIT